MCRWSSAGPLYERGQDVHGDAALVAHLPGCNGAGPGKHSRHAHTAFEQAAFGATILAVTPAVVHASAMIGPFLLRGAVIAHEEYHRVIEPPRRQRGEHGTDRIVQRGDHGGMQAAV